MTRSKNVADMEGKSSDKEEEEMSSQDDDQENDQVDDQETMEDVKSMRMMKAAKQHREQSINASYLNVVKEMNALNKDASKLTLKEVPVTVLAEVRHCVQLLGHINEVYRASAFPLLQAYMMRYPVLLPCAVNNIFFIYANAKNKFQKQAKLMGVGAVLRCDAAVHDKSLLRKLVSEIITLRNPSDRDDAEIFFLVSALQSDAAVQPVCEIILEGMGEELQHSIKEIKPSLLWLRVVLAQRMLVTGLKLPVWLKDTFLPDRVVQFGLIIMPKSQKLEPQHPMFENFISTLAAFDNTLKKMRKRKPSHDGKLPRPSAVAILFREEISPAIEKCFGEKKKKPTLEIAYKLLQSVLSCDEVEVSVLEGVVQWLGGGGLRCLTPDMRNLVVQGLLTRLSSLASLETDEERSTLAVCVLQGAVVFPEMLQHAKEHLHLLTASAAQACVDDLLRAFWRKLSEVEASVLLRLVALRQCSGKDHLEWRLKVTQSMTRKALQTSNDEVKEKDEEKRFPLDQDSGCFVGEHVNNRDLFFRFLNHCSHDKSTVCDVLIEAHRVAEKEVRDNPDVLPTETREMWQRLTEKIEFLQSPQRDKFAFNRLFQVLFSQFALELLKKSSSGSEDLSDLETCLEKALAEEQPQGLASVGVSSEKQKEMEEDVDWVLVLVDVLLALGAREDSWWRAILQPAARQLSRRMTVQCAASITEVLLRDDVLQPDEDEDEMEHDGEQGERYNWEDVDEEEAESESEEEEGEKEENEENSDDMDSEGEDSGGNDCDSDGGEESDEGDDEDMTRLDVIKTALRGAMMPVPNSALVSDHLVEDMDAVPIEELRLMDKRMAKVLGEHIKKRPKSGKKFSLKGESAQRLQYRNRALDLVEGLVQGSPLPSVLLGSVLLPLLRALELHHSKLMRPLVNRIREVLKEVRNVKKYAAHSEPVEDEELVDFLEEVFSLAGKVPECSHGVVTLLRYSTLRQRDRDTPSNPVMDAYIGHIRDMLQSRKINKSVIVEPLNLDIPTLRAQIIETIVAEAFPTTPTTYSFTSTEASLSNPTQNPSDRSSNNTDAASASTCTTHAASITTDTAPSAVDTACSGSISKSKQYAAWDLLKDVFAKTLTSACTELSKQEAAALTSLGLYIEQYFTACQDLVKKELEPISIILKLIRKHPASTGCVNWLSLGSSLRAFRSRVSPMLVGKKKLKKDVDRLATIVLQREDGHRSVIDEDKLCLKRKRKELKREKEHSKKTKISLNDRQIQSVSKISSIDSKKKGVKQKDNKVATKTKSVDDLFEAEDAFLDANDSDSDKEDLDDGDAADDNTIKTKLAVAKSNKEKKAAKTRARKMRYKANLKLKKEVAREMKRRMMTEKRQLAGEQEETDGGKENAGPGAGGGRVRKDSERRDKKTPPQERRPKEQPKTGKWKAAEALDADLQAGIFSQGSLVE